jgi:hypothetical protein
VCRILFCAGGLVWLFGYMRHELVHVSYLTYWSLSLSTPISIPQNCRICSTGDVLTGRWSIPVAGREAHARDTMPRTTCRFVQIVQAIATTLLVTGALCASAASPEDNRMVIALILRHGPSNQLYQAKMAAWGVWDAIAQDNVTLVLPPVQPHYLHGRSERAVPFSVHFDVKSPPFVEEHAFLRGNLSALQSPRPCPVLYKATPKVTVRACEAYAHRFPERARGRVCAAGVTMVPFNAGLAGLATDPVRRRRTLGGAQFALACNLESFVPPGDMYAAIDDGRGGYLMRTATGQEWLPAKAAAWVELAGVLGVRTDLVHLPAAHSTLVLHCRTPDQYALNQTRRSHFCFGDDVDCHPQGRHVYLHRDAVSRLVKKRLEEAQDSPTSAAGNITRVHVMTNDPQVADHVAETLGGQGVHVTASVDRSLAELASDYGLATAATEFWGTAGSSITANVAHARLAVGQPAVSFHLWDRRGRGGRGVT